MSPLHRQGTRLLPRAWHLRRLLCSTPPKVPSKPKPFTNKEDGIIAVTGQALANKIAVEPDSLVARVADRFALPQKFYEYSKNMLTHGEDFLRGDDEFFLFAPGVWHAPLKWRPIPGEGTVSLSRATLTTTESGTAMLRGMYGGSRGEFALLEGSISDLESSPVGAGACGVASLGHWPIALDQHHWLELRVRTGDRAFDLIVQAEGSWEGSTRIWRAHIPDADTFDAMHGRPARSQEQRDSADSADGGDGGDGSSSSGGGGVGKGAYGVLNVSADASDAEIRESYRQLVMQSHPDRPGGGDVETQGSHTVPALTTTACVHSPHCLRLHALCVLQVETFKRVSRAYALIGEPEKRAKYDEVGADLGSDEEDDAGLDDLGPWRHIKVPFTAFRDRNFYDRSDKVSVVYVLLAGEEPGSFALEIGEIKAGRCEKAHLMGANFWGYAACEQGFCECGFYNGMRAEAFDGPIKPVKGKLRKDALKWGYAEHHIDEETGEM